MTNYITFCNLLRIDPWSIKNAYLFNRCTAKARNFYEKEMQA